ncbi:AzlD family protein [Ferrovibrio sp.]|uniref:AzlD family protein n=1 Tax=Ferrovibrio sp. TaxID=1917215 RepID=UPI0035159859
MTTDLFAVDPIALAAILGMAVATYLTRAGGFWLMGHVAISPRLERFLRHMAGGVLIAIVTAAVFNGDGPLWIGLGIVVLVMLTMRKPILALAAGVAGTILLRLLGF